MLSRILAGVVALAALAQAASAASLEGTALVNRGNGFVAQRGGALQPGDRIMVQQGATAHVSYADGCVHVLSPGEVLTVSTAGGCSLSGGNVRTIDFSNRMHQGASPNANEQPATDNTALIIGGAALIGGVGAAIILSRKASSP